MKKLKQTLNDYNEPQQKQEFIIIIVKEWLIQKRQEVTERRRNGEAFFGNQILNELLNDLLDELKI